MENPCLNDNFVDAAALRRYNFFKGLVLLLLAALLLGLLSFTRQSANIEAPTLSGPDGMVAPGMITLNGRGTPNSDIDVHMNGKSIGMATVDAEGNWSLITDVAAGEHDFVALALDPDGAEHGRSAGLTLNVVEPVVYTAPTLALPTGDLDMAAVSFSGTGTPGSTVDLFNNGVSIGTTAVDANGQWNLAAPIHRYINDLQAFGFDPAGAAIGNSGVQRLLLPAAAASLTLDTTDLGNFTLTDDGIPQSTLRLAGTAEPFTRVRLALGDLDLGIVDVDANGNWSFDGDITLEPGTYDLQARMIAADDVELGAVGAAGLVVPELAVGQPVTVDAAGVVDAGDGTGELTLRGTAVPGSQIEILINGEVVDTVTANANGGWTYAATLPTGSYVINGRYLDLSEAEADILAAAQNVIIGQPVGDLQLLFAGASEAGQPGAAPAGSPAVEIILDASWSMTEQLGDETRFETARTALQNITGNVLPDGTPIAVRVFGNIEGDYACRTDLMVPYQSLDRAAMNDFLADVEPQFNANTPIADSLARVTSDLADAGELGRIVVLLTDGEETCGGDPAAQIQQLRDAGVNIQINIVGLAIADEALKAEFARWAELGGGQYFDVTDPGRLAEVLGEAILIPYVVRDEAGDVVANGRVGGLAQTLPIGTYSVEIRTVPAVTIDVVEILAGERVQLTLDE